MQIIENTRYKGYSKRWYAKLVDEIISVQFHKISCTLRKKSTLVTCKVL